jgi:chemotaxis protein methyltransferase CheR
MAVEISLEELDALCNAIKQRHGIDFTQYESASFARRVSRAIDYFKMDNLMALWSKILSDRNFMFDFVDAITVGMTSLFRDPQFWRTLKTKVMMTELKNANSINVWHAGCSTGEEVYSFGILLQDVNMQGKVKAIATDLNRNSIEICKKGVYDNMTIPQNEKQLKEYNPFKQFKDFNTPGERYYTMKPELVKHVNFQVGNLTKDPIPGKYDIIFCRNVMIYFDDSLKRALLDKFYDALNPGGFFIIGFFDSLVNVIDKNKFEFYDLSAKIFRKK